MPTPKRGTTADPKTADEEGSTVAVEDPEPTEKEDNDDGRKFAKFYEIGEKTTTFTWRNVKFRVPTSRSQWPTRAMQAFQRQNMADGIELLFGPQQWELFNQVAPLLADLWEFVPIFGEATGFVKYEDD